MSSAGCADQLGCRRNTLKRVVSGEASLKPEIALALELIGVGKAEFWLGMQASYDLFQLPQACNVA
ncbi:HigA family addiction module antitoxin [Litorivivens sp.]|uniref:HigA family addiction module antitoxin n=1 Tax=Litorivivens sp. TaxID=2020868 RepID=UPI00356252D0